MMAPRLAAWRRILLTLVENPGVSLATLQQATGLKDGTVSAYVSMCIHRGPGGALIDRTEDGGLWPAVTRENIERAPRFWDVQRRVEYGAGAVDG